MSRQIGLLHPTELYPMQADTVQTVLCVGSSNGQAFDWPTSTGGAAANASAAGAHVVRFTAQTTAGAVALAGLQLNSTAAALPSSGQVVGSTSNPTAFFWGTQTFQIPGNSTGWSAIALGVSAYVQAEIWRK